MCPFLLEFSLNPLNFVRQFSLLCLLPFFFPEDTCQRAVCNKKSDWLLGVCVLNCDWLTFDSKSCIFHFDRMFISFYHSYIFSCLEAWYKNMSKLLTSENWFILVFAVILTWRGQFYIHRLTEICQCCLSQSEESFFSGHNYISFILPDLSNSLSYQSLR